MKLMTKLNVFAVYCIAAFATIGTCFGQAKEKVYSGPQPGEKITSFKVVELGAAAGKSKIDPIAENGGKPIALVFVHGVERSMAPLLQTIDQYGAERKQLLRTEMVFLSGDRLAAEQRFPAVARSLRLQSRFSLSVDGAEGPGNYGLNKECLLTVVVAKEDRVTANFALVQPGIADAPKIIEALATTAGDRDPPRAADLEARRRESTGRAMGRDAMRSEMARPAAGRAATDFSKLNLESEAGLRDAVKLLIAEVQSLRAELDAGLPKPQTEAGKGNLKEELPGAAPTDQRLIGLLRRFIQPTNDDATVDRVLADVEHYVKGDQALTKQAIGGWTRVLHLKYGTPYAHKAGQAFVDKLKK
ncbi:MAG: hypothetical protein FJ403_00415 [Verrucomicrobia bacterium]|nr:hypothetical protein [Verrucomicrobiota bacterium]